MTWSPSTYLPVDRLELSRDDLMLRIAARALLLASPARSTARERRLLALATEVAERPTAARLEQHAFVYLGLACCSWARRRRHREKRDAAVLAATIFAASVLRPLREVMGLETELLRAAAAPGVDPRVGAAARSVVGSDTPPEHELRHTIARAFMGVERRCG